MAAQRVPWWQPRMLEIEILCRVPGHPELFHDPPRRRVRRHREGDDLFETEPAEPVIDCGPRGLVGIAPSPIAMGQAPSSLDRRRKRQREAQIAEADNADKRRFTGKLDDPGTEAMVLPMRARRRDLGVHGCAVRKGHEVSHDGRIG